MLKELNNIFAPPACEKAAAEYIQKSLKKTATVQRDAMGNVIAHIGGKGKKLLISANLDEPGFMVTHIDDNGFMRFAAAGQISPCELINAKVIFSDGVMGVIACEAEKSLAEIKTSNLFIDCGFSSREEAEKHISVSDMAVLSSDEQNLKLFCKTSPRLCCGLLAELSDEIKFSKYDLYFAFTVQKEVGFRGITPVMNAVMPDIAIALCAVKANDIPGGKGEIKLGGGPVIAIKDGRSVLSPSLVSSLRNICNKNSIPYQFAAFKEQLTEAPLMQSAAEGTPSAAVCVPVRYIHTANELVKAEDIKAVRDLIINFISEEEYDR